jgi:hypothetical protein
MLEVPRKKSPPNRGVDAAGGQTGWVPFRESFPDLKPTPDTSPSADGRRTIPSEGRESFSSSCYASLTACAEHQKIATAMAESDVYAYQRWTANSVFRSCHPLAVAQGWLRLSSTSPKLFLSFFSSAKSRRPASTRQPCGSVLRLAK